MPKKTVPHFSDFTKITEAAQKLLKIIFNNDYRFVQRIFPGMSILGVVCFLTVPIIDKLCGMYNSYLLALPTGILSIFLWFMPRKGPLNFYHKVYWEVFCLYSLSFVGAWLTFSDTSAYSLAINLQIPGMFCGFFCKPIVFWLGYPFISSLTFLIYTRITGTNSAELFSLVFYPFVGAMIHGSAAVTIRLVMEYYYHKLLDTELKIVTMQTEKQLSDFKLATLRAKSDPHFLFNTLNSICQLARTNPAETEKAILSLSNTFRYVLEAGEQATVRLKDELSIVTAHLELERLRFGEKLTYAINMNCDIQDIRVPALSIQPLVENSIKHGFAHKNGNGIITICIDRNDSTAVITVQDNGTGFGDNQPVYGHGLSILEDRLKHIWGNSASLHLFSSDDIGTTVELRIPVECCHDL